MQDIERRPTRRRWLVPAVAGGALVAAGLVWWTSFRAPDTTARKGQGAIPVMTTLVQSRDLPVRLRANGTAVALQSVEIRGQITSTVRTVHIREGQNVRAGELLFSLDARAEEAAIKKAQAQVEKDRADLAIATRNFERQRELFAQKFISQSSLDAAQNQVDALTAQLAVDRAAVESARVAQAYMEIRAPFSGRTGIINVRAGSLVQPNTAVLVTITQIDPMSVAFSLPEKELAGIQRAMAAGPVSASARVDGAPPITGKLVFVDNAVDPTTATIRVKAEFGNSDARLWPGMFVGITLAPRVLQRATIVPSQAVQTGPDSQFVYVVGEDRKVTVQPVTLVYVEDGMSAVDGVAAGARIVVEGAQNLRPGSVVMEAERAEGKGNAKSGDTNGKDGKDNKDKDNKNDRKDGGRGTGAGAGEGSSG